MGGEVWGRRGLGGSDDPPTRAAPRARPQARAASGGSASTSRARRSRRASSAPSRASSAHSSAAQSSTTLTPSRRQRPTRWASSSPSMTCRPSGPLLVVPLLLRVVGLAEADGPVVAGHIMPRPRAAGRGHTTPRERCGWCVFDFRSKGLHFRPLNALSPLEGPENLSRLFDANKGTFICAELARRGRAREHDDVGARLGFFDDCTALKQECIRAAARFSDRAPPARPPPPWR